MNSSGAPAVVSSSWRNTSRSEVSMAFAPAYAFKASTASVPRQRERRLSCKDRNSAQRESWSAVPRSNRPSDSVSYESKEPSNSASRSASCARTRAKALLTLARPRAAARSMSFRRHASLSVTTAKSSSSAKASSRSAPARARNASYARLTRMTSWPRCGPCTTQSEHMQLHSQVVQKYVARSSGCAGHEVGRGDEVEIGSLRPTAFGVRGEATDEATGPSWQSRACEFRLELERAGVILSLGTAHWSLAEGAGPLLFSQPPAAASAGPRAV
mmetsp:Transcript_42080/g.116243  ORF Transcript_42080/g.116243 Transcript_42080/m.116243 type:complete len:272 (+) Transcript_42080:410-1225(+)